MRLTLRTLLAYLDDQLEPAEIKRIGQKVAESDAAQELIARIRQVTRRRRLTTPTDGGAGERFDANTVAEYLDSELSAEQIADLEKICLESDVHLAEVSACHQILTLVLGEPALIPPTARRRMYDLVQGRKPKPARKPVPAATSPNGQPATTEPDADETLLLGLPLFRKAPWLRWAVPLAAVLLLAVLGGVLWRTLSNSGGGTRIAANGNPSDESPKDRDADRQKDKDKTGDKTKQPDQGSSKDKDNKQDKDKPKDPVKDKPKEPDKGTVTLPPPIDKPNDERKEAGRFVSTGAVLARQGKDAEWERVPVDSTVQSGEALVSLPGYRSELRLSSGVGLLLWGTLPEIPMPKKLPLRESAVTLHQAPRGVDADLTLQRGRIYLTNRKEKGPAIIRVRFWREEVWDVTLEEPETVAGLEFFSGYGPNMKFRSSGEEPVAVVVLFFVKGKGKVKLESDTFAMQALPGPALLFWNNKLKRQGPFADPAAAPFWNPDRSLPREHQVLVAAREELANQLAKPGRAVEVGLQESLQSNKSEHRILAIRCLGALDAVGALIDGLGDPMHPEVRVESAEALRIWIGRGKEQAGKLYDPKKRTGILTDKKFRADEAESVLELLDGLTEQDIRQRETYDALLAYLKHNRLEVRELAYEQLMSIFREEGSKINYNPAGTSEQISEGYEEWRKLVSKLLPKKSGS
ncbi:MAG: hypothetical protein HYS12_06115 [Planctomycetes bacterium]|nr:hypothetical protein [Planctomycetota bacterium]